MLKLHELCLGKRKRCLSYLARISQKPRSDVACGVTHLKNRLGVNPVVLQVCGAANMQRRKGAEEGNEWRKGRRSAESRPLRLEGSSCTTARTEETDGRAGLVERLNLSCVASLDLQEVHNEESVGRSVVWEGSPRPGDLGGSGGSGGCLRAGGADHCSRCG